MHGYIRLRPAILLSVTLAALHAPAASAQDQITKPPNTTTATTRLPAPNPVTARQLSDGRIEVRWPSVEGAVRYDVWRSVPPAAQTQITRSNPADTVYTDADVKAGSTYYYLVAAVNSAGTAGLRGAAAPVAAVTTAGATTTPSTTTTTPTATGPHAPITAEYTRSGIVEVFWDAPPGATGYKVERLTYAALPGDSTKMDASSVQTKTTMTSYPTYSDGTLGLQPAPRWVQYRVTPSVLFTSPPPPLLSPIVLIPAAWTTPTTTAPATTATTTLSVATPSTLKVGGTASLASLTGVTNARWISMNESIATVDAAGMITARAAGVTQVLALTAAADGSARVVSVAVNVTP